MRITAIAASRSIEETGVRRNLLEDLALKILYQMGEMSLHELASHMGLSLGVMERVFQRLRKEQLIQVNDMAGSVYRVTTTAAGKSQALELLSQNQYAGPTPVSLDDQGKPHGSSPPTPPYMRVRIRRFRDLSR